MLKKVEIRIFPKTVLCNKTALQCMFHLISMNNKVGIIAKVQKFASLSQSQISLIRWVTPSPFFRPIETLSEDMEISHL